MDNEKAKVPDEAVSDAPEIKMGVVDRCLGYGACFAALIVACNCKRHPEFAVNTSDYVVVPLAMYVMLRLLWKWQQILRSCTAMMLMLAFYGLTILGSVVNISRGDADMINMVTSSAASATMLCFSFDLVRRMLRKTVKGS